MFWGAACATQLGYRRSFGIVVGAFALLLNRGGCDDLCTTFLLPARVRSPLSESSTRDHNPPHAADAQERHGDPPAAARDGEGEEEDHEEVAPIGDRESASHTFPCRRQPGLVLGRTPTKESLFYREGVTTGQGTKQKRVSAQSSASTVGTAESATELQGHSARHPGVAGDDESGNQVRHQSTWTESAVRRAEMKPTDERVDDVMSRFEKLELRD